jgi:hypothetical protein
MKSEDFKASISATQFRESVIGTALARHYGFLFQPNPFPLKNGHSKTCDYGLIDSTLSKAWRVEQQDCFHLDSIEDGKFAFELFINDDDGTKRDGKLMYCDADKFVYSASKLERLFIFEWIPLRELLLDLYDQGKAELLSFNRSNWNQDSCPIDLLLFPVSIILAQTSVKEFSYSDLNIKHIYKHYE